jgi:uncharacterized protein (TIGR02001 family)
MYRQEDRLLCVAPVVCVVVGIFGFAATWYLLSADHMAASAETADNNATQAIDVVDRGGIGQQTLPSTTLQKGRNESVEFGMRAGFATEYVSRGVTESAHQPAIGAIAEAVAFEHFYASAGVTSVRLPNNAVAEIALSTGIRPKIGNVDLDFGWTYYLYPSSVAPPAGTLANINYLEMVARADTNFGESVHFAAGSAYSPSYSNTGAWSDYSAFGVAVELPGKSLPPDLTVSISGGGGYYWFGNEAPTLGGFPLPAYLNWNAGVTFVQKNLHFDLRYYDTNLSRSQCFVLTGDLNGGFGGQINPVSNPLGRVSDWCGATLVAKFWFAFN